jgi:ribosomal protein S18
MAEENKKPISEETVAPPAASEKKEAPAAARPESRPTPARRTYSPQRSRPAPRGRGSRARRAKVCQFCVEKTEYIDYKKPELLLPFISPYGKMLSRRRTGVCAKHQRSLAVAIKRARFLALLPYTAEHIRRFGS